MKWLLSFFIITLSFMLSVEMTAQSDAPKREFRGVWVATVVNLDFPSSKNLDSESQKQEWIRLLDEYQAMGINAVVFQVRPAGDAFYQSDLAPWSGYLTGRQGAPPEPYYDPLQFYIEEAHKRSMEFHAWFNPYRATMNDKTNELSSQHMLKKRPDWFVEYGGRYYFNPALEEVRDHIVDVVKEVVENYDIDAVHFDDYFYPYKKEDLEFPDKKQFEETGKEFSSVGDWRRHNVDMLIDDLSKMIKETKPYVKFGISPFGVWRNESTDPINGSATRAGVESYDDLNADILKWLELGWIDYVVPQLYWTIGFKVADHKVLVDWWSQNTYGKHLYIGHATYKIGNSTPTAWKNPNEVPNQIQLGRATDAVSGSIHFRSKYLLENPLGFSDALKNSIYNKPAMLPESAFLKQPTHHFPLLKILRNTNQGIRLRWKYHKKNLDNPPFYYSIYRFEKGEPQNFDNPKNLLAITPFDQNKRSWEFFDATAQAGTKYVYVVKPVNRQHSEGLPSKARRIRAR